MIFGTLFGFGGWFGVVHLGKNFKLGGGYAHSGSAEIPTTDVSNIKLEWIDGDVDICYYDGDSISIEESRVSERKRLNYEIQGNTLCIKEYGRFGHFLFDGSKDLTLKIPRYSVIDELDIDVVSTDVNIDGISVSELELDTVSGEADVLLSNQPEDIDFDSVSGDIRLTLPKDITGYDVSFDSVSGDFSSKDFNNDSSYGDNAVKIEADSVSGNFEISSR